MLKQERNITFDVLKGVACIAVVLIHYGFKGTFGVAVNSLLRFAVPIFFGISGYYLSSSNLISDEKVIRKIRHILKILLFSGVFYLFFFIIWNQVMYSEFDFGAFINNRITAGRIVKLFFSNDPLVYAHLWFLLALLYCYFAVLFIFKYITKKWLLYIFIPLLLFGMTSLQEFSSFLPFKSFIALPGSKENLYIHNLFIFRALPFFLIGMCFRDYKNFIIKIPGNSIWIFVALLGCAVAVLERNFVGKNCQFFIGSYITFISLFIYAIKKPKVNISFLSFIGQELSMYVYILHIAVGKTYDLVAKEYRLWGNPYYSHTRPFVVILVSILISYIIYSLVKFKKQKQQKVVS